MKNPFFVFFGSPAGLHKIHTYRGHQNVSKCRSHHSGDICTEGKTLENQVFISGVKMYIFINLYFNTSYGGYNKHFPNYEQILNILMG